MSTPTPTEDKYQEIKDILIDFGIPVILIIVLSLLLVFKVDSEVKTLLAAVIGWITKSGISRARS